MEKYINGEDRVKIGQDSNKAWVEENIKKQARSSSSGWADRRPSITLRLMSGSLTRPGSLQGPGMYSFGQMFLQKYYVLAVIG